MKSKVKNGGAPRKIKAIYKKGFLLFTFDLPNTTNTTKFKMKTLIIIRHAKSSWDNIGQHDRERPLNERGKADAPEMAQRLKEKDLDVDLFVSSPAKRAKRTARYFAEAFGQDKDDVVLVEPLYGADVATFYHIVGNLEDKYDTIAVFSHNPGITEFVNTLTGVHVDNMPTCALFAVQAEAESWRYFKESEKKFLFFDYPKNPLGQFD